MGTITFALSTSSSPYGDPQFGMSAVIPFPDITVSERTFSIPAITGTMTSYASKGNTYPQNRYQNSATFSAPIYINGADTNRFLYYSYGYLYIGSSSGWASANWSATQSEQSSLSTSTYFNSSNKTTRTATITLGSSFWSAYNETGSYSSSSASSGSATLTLNAPPTFKVTDSSGTETTQVYFDTPYVYSGLTTASIKVANLSAKYSGTITSATLTIGDQTVSRSNNGVLSILLNAGGTFTPTVTVTDSRGQTTTKTLNPITVNVYTTPTVNFEAQRTLATGVPDDEGTYAVINPKFTFIDVIAELQAPTITATDEGGITETPTVTWYSTRASDGTLSGSVTWSSLSSGDTVYGRLSLQSGFDVLQSYQISVTPIDSEGTGTAKTQMFAPAFFTIDVLAGGHGIAFGTPATDEVFECAMPTSFLDMTSQEVDDFVDSLVVGGGGTAVDLVVEQGTSGIWTYRKWSSGIAECWGTWSGTLTHYGTQFGGYAFYTSVAFPSGLFISAPLVTYSGAVDGGFCLTGTVLSLSKDSTNCYAISGASGTQPVKFYVSCKGRWK